jgi:hypothetical protein
MRTILFDDWNPAARSGSVRAPILAIAEIPGDHFDVYAPPIRDEAAAIEARFLRERLLR